MQKVTIGIDLGTSGLKALAITSTGEAVAEASSSYPLLTPHPGWTEQNPADWVHAARVVLKEITAKLEGFEIVGLSAAGQMHGAVFLDENLAVVRPAPLWNDQRTAAACEEIERAVPRAELIRRTGNPAVTGFQLPKLVWLRSVEPENFAKTKHVLLPKDYLTLQLTGELVTEPSDASGIGCLNLETQNWDLTILDALKLDPSLFPRLIPSSSVAGGLTKAWALETGLKEGLPVIAGAGDNAGAAIGLGLSSARPGIGSVSLGTSGVIFLPLEKPSVDPEGRVHLFCHADGGYHFLGVTLAAAGSLQWFRDSLAADTEFETLMTEASSVPAGSEGLLFLPYLAGERSPHLDPNVRGAWIGLSLAHHRPHLTRALLEGVAFSLADTLEVMRPLAPLEKLLSIGGGSKSDFWLGIVGSVLGVKLERPDFEEGPARGAAVLALVGSGVYSTVAAALEATAPKSVDFPTVAEPAYKRSLERYRAAYPAIKALSS